MSEITENAIIDKEFIPYLRTGQSYSPDELIRLITRALEISKPGLKIVPYRNEIHVGKLNEITGEKNDHYANEIPDELIAWRYLKQAPGARGSDPFIGISERKPQYRELIEDDKGIRIRYGWIVDSLLGFQLLAKSTGERIELTNWFRNRMLALTPIIRFLGAERFYWLGCSLADEKNYTMPIKDFPEEKFFIRTGIIYEIEVNTLNKLFIELGLGPDLREQYQEHINNLLRSMRTYIN